MGPVAHNLSHVRFVGVEPPLGNRPSTQALRWGSATSSLSFRPEPAAQHPRTLTSNREEPAQSFLAWLLGRLELNAGAYKPNALERRLPACLRALRVHSSAAARELLERRPDLLPLALNTLIIGVSGFFRDPPVFAHLRRCVLPRLTRGQQGVRVFSAGCAEGQELYSIAMLLDELGVLPQSELVGMDCRSVAIARARTGVFPASELEQVPLEFRERFFTQEGTQVRISPSLRLKIRWWQGDVLGRNQEVEACDLVLFRNVAIYFRPEASGVWKTLADYIKPGGVLVTGKAERPPAGTGFKCIGPNLFEKSEVTR